MKKIISFCLTLLISCTLSAQKKQIKEDKVKQNFSIANSQSSTVSKRNIPNYEARQENTRKLLGDTTQFKSRSGNIIKYNSLIEKKDFKEDVNKKGFPLAWSTNSKERIFLNNEIILDKKNQYLMKYIDVDEISDIIYMKYKCYSSAKIELLYFNNVNKQISSKRYELYQGDSGNLDIPIKIKEIFSNVLIKVTSTSGGLIIKEIKY